MTCMLIFINLTNGNYILQQYIFAMYKFEYFFIVSLLLSNYLPWIKALTFQVKFMELNIV